MVLERMYQRAQSALLAEAQGADAGAGVPVVALLGQGPASGGFFGGERHLSKRPLTGVTVTGAESAPRPLVPLGLTRVSIVTVP